jgi:Flp pilus assembly protein CpaB
MRVGRLLLIIGLIIVVAVAAVGGYLYFLGGGFEVEAPTPEPVVPQPTPIPTREVIVAAQDIPRGTAITAESGAVVTTTWPAEAVSELSLTSIQAAYGRVTRQDIARGTPLVKGMLTEQPGDLGAAGSDAAMQIPSGKVAYALPVSRYSSVAWALAPGDHVDAIISVLTVELDEEFQSALPNTFACASTAEGCAPGVLGRLESLPNGWIVNVLPSEGQRPRLVTQLTVQDATVLRVGDWDEELEKAAPTPTPEAEAEAEEAEEPEATPTPPPPPKVRPLTLAVTPQEAAVLKYAEEAGASIDLVLRSAADAERVVSTESVTLEYLFEQFDIELPSKLPYGLEPSRGKLPPGAGGETQPLQVEGGRVPETRGRGATEPAPPAE